MPLPSSGQISFGQVADITQGSATATVSLNDSLVRTLFGVSSGQISLSSGYGKPSATTTSFTTNGTFNFIIPIYQYFKVTVNGPGGGGGGGGAHVVGINFSSGAAGTTGTPASQFSTVIGNAGGGGAGGVAPGTGTAATGTAGTATGGDTNNTGLGSTGGAGGAPYGPAQTGGTGGRGGQAIKTWRFASTSGYPGWGGTVPLIVGNGGTGGAAGSIYLYGSGVAGSAGSKGSIIFEGT